MSSIEGRAPADPGGVPAHVRIGKDIYEVRIVGISEYSAEVLSPVRLADRGRLRLRFPHPRTAAVVVARGVVAREGEEGTGYRLRIDLEDTLADLEVDGSSGRYAVISAGKLERARRRRAAQKLSQPGRPVPSVDRRLRNTSSLIPVLTPLEVRFELRGHRSGVGRVREVGPRKVVVMAKDPPGLERLVDIHVRGQTETGPVVVHLQGRVTYSDSEGLGSVPGFTAEILRFEDAHSEQAWQGLMARHERRKAVRR